MSHRISQETAETIRRLAASQWPQREIARQLQVSTTSVHRVLHGTWASIDDSDDPWAKLKRQARRCPGCGGLVYEWPCRTCRMRERVEQERTTLKRAA
jgi:hypothetical protein